MLNEIFSCKATTDPPLENLNMVNITNICCLLFVGEIAKDLGFFRTFTLLDFRHFLPQNAAKFWQELILDRLLKPVET